MISLNLLNFYLPLLFLGDSMALAHFAGEKLQSSSLIFLKSQEYGYLISAAIVLIFVLLLFLYESLRAAGTMPLLTMPADTIPTACKEHGFNPLQSQIDNQKFTPLQYPPTSTTICCLS